LKRIQMESFNIIFFAVMLMFHGSHHGLIICFTPKLIAFLIYNMINIQIQSQGCNLYTTSYFGFFWSFIASTELRNSFSNKQWLTLGSWATNNSSSWLCRLSVGFIDLPISFTFTKWKSFLTLQNNMEKI